MLILLGLIAGLLSGLVGIGGGVVIVPALIIFFHYSQKMAQGTTLALLVLPIGILAALTYYRSGFVDIKAAGLIVAGFVVGGYFGSRWAVSLPDAVLAKAFGGFLLVLSVKFLFFTK